MLRSLFSIFCAIWLFLSPCLCSAGVLQHACECVEDTAGSACESHCLSHEGLQEESHGEHEDFGLPEGGCSHDGCENDPCQVALRVSKKSSSELSSTSDLAPTPALLAELYSRDAQRHTRPTPLPLGPPRLTGDNLPFFVADVPLLI